ncbi:MAG: hypothetical protein U0791_26635 [Gemmataceae bacterium]
MSTTAEPPRYVAGLTHGLRSHQYVMLIGRSPDGTTWALVRMSDLVPSLAITVPVPWADDPPPRSTVMYTLDCEMLAATGSAPRIAGGVPLTEGGSLAFPDMTATSTVAMARTNAARLNPNSRFTG